MHNVFNSNAAYPILMRRPWNQEATGILAVNNYDEFLKLVEVIADSYRVKTERCSLDQPSVIVLVGPSGSGKNEVARELLEQRVAEAENTSDVYDEQNEYREDFIMAVLYDAASAALAENAALVSRELTVELQYQAGQWWVVADKELLDALFGGIL
jgi:guanylate kinase